MTVVLALFAGLLTVAAPCTLPILPILLGGSIGQPGRLRPVFIAAGFVASFAAAVLVFSAVTEIAGIDQDTLRNLAVILLVLFGLMMLFPRVPARLGGVIASLAPSLGHRSGNLGGFVLGTTLGLVWTPCAGPILASILVVIATSAEFGRGALLLLAYAIGASVPMLAIAYGGQMVTTRVRCVSRLAGGLQQGFGVVTIAFAVAMHLHYDTLVAASLSGFYPGGRLGL